MQRPRDLPGWHRWERDLRVPGEGLVARSEGGGAGVRGCANLVHLSTRRTSVAQPARSVGTPTGLGLTANQVSAGPAGGQGQCPLGGQCGPSRSNQPLSDSLPAVQPHTSPLGSLLDHISSPGTVLFLEACSGQPSLSPHTRPDACAGLPPPLRSCPTPLSSGGCACGC